MKKGVSERRRKDHIAALILKLGDKLPQSGEHRPQQKVGILGRAIDYITELESKNTEDKQRDGNYRKKIDWVLRRQRSLFVVRFLPLGLGMFK